MNFWFGKKGNGIVNHKCISINYHVQHFLVFSCKTNGAIKGVDSCFDLNIRFFGLFFSYTNFDYL